MASERKQPRFCVLTEHLPEESVLAALRKGEGSGGVFFYKHSSCGWDRTKTPWLCTMPWHGRRRMSGCAEKPAEQGASRELIMTMSPGMVRGSAVLVQTPGLVNSQHKRNEKSQEEPLCTKEPSLKQKGWKAQAVRFAKGKDMAPNCPVVGGWPAISVCLGRQGFLECETFSVKTRKSPRCESSKK